MRRTQIQEVVEAVEQHNPLAKVALLIGNRSKSTKGNWHLVSLDRWKQSRSLKALLKTEPGFQSEVVLTGEAFLLLQENPDKTGKTWIASLFGPVQYQEHLLFVVSISEKLIQPFPRGYVQLRLPMTGKF